MSKTPLKVIVCLNQDGTHQVLFKPKGVEVEVREYDIVEGCEQFDKLSEDFEEGEDVYNASIYPAEDEIDDTCDDDTGEDDWEDPFAGEIDPDESRMGG